MWSFYWEFCHSCLSGTLISSFYMPLFGFNIRVNFYQKILVVVLTLTIYGTVWGALMLILTLVLAEFDIETILSRVFFFSCQYIYLVGILCDAWDWIQDFFFCRLSIILRFGLFRESQISWMFYALILFFKI